MASHSPRANRETTAVPIATRSGLIRPEPWFGPPRELKEAIRSGLSASNWSGRKFSDAPMDKPFLRFACWPREFTCGPSFPAENSIIRSFDWSIWVSAALAKLSYCPPVPLPQLSTMTRAPSLYSSSQYCELVERPPVQRATPSNEIRASGATPASLRSQLKSVRETLVSPRSSIRYFSQEYPFDATIPATC